MQRLGLICLLLLAVSCTRSTGPVAAARAQAPHRPPLVPWILEPSVLPAGAQTLGTVAPGRYFPLHEAFTRRHGTTAGMSAWKIPFHDRTWWAVDTRYTFATEDDAARFLISQQALLSEGHPLAEDRLTLSCGPGGGPGGSDARPGCPSARLFIGRILHPGLGTPFFTFVAVGRHRQHVFKFLAAVEVPPGTGPEAAPDAQPTLPPEVLRTDFLALAAMALKP